MSDDLSKAKMFEGGEEESPWKFISFALVSEDNTEGKDIIKVWLYELLPFEEGEIKEIKVKEDQELLDMNGVKKKVTIDRKAQIEARWYPTVDGRQTPPNVVSGETVEIYKYGHEDIYRWVSNGRQTELRRLEHVTYAYSNLKDGRKAFDGKSSYGWTYSTREKIVRVWTRKSDGESFEYQWFIDTKNNKMKFHDDIGNIFGLHSDTVDVYLRNSANSYARALQSEVILNAAARILLQSPLVQVTTILDVGAVLRVPLIIADVIQANVVIAAIVPTPSGGSPSVSSMPGIDIEEEMTIGETSTEGASGTSGNNNNATLSADAGGAPSDAVEGFHDRCHVYSRNDDDFLSVGNKWEAYTHYDNGNAETVANDLISETSEVNITNATSSATTNTPLQTFSENVYIKKNLIVGGALKILNGGNPDPQDLASMLADLQSQIDALK